MADDEESTAVLGLWGLASFKDITRENPEDWPFWYDDSERRGSPRMPRFKDDHGAAVLLARKMSKVEQVEVIFYCAADFAVQVIWRGVAPSAGSLGEALLAALVMVRQRERL